MTASQLCVCVCARARACVISNRNAISDSYSGVIAWQKEYIIVVELQIFLVVRWRYVGITGCTFCYSG